VRQRSEIIGPTTVTAAGTQIDSGHRNDEPGTDPTPNREGRHAAVTPGIETSAARSASVTVWPRLAVRGRVGFPGPQVSG